MTATFKILPSTPYPLGIRKQGKRIFASMVSNEKDCGILLYSSKETEPLKIAFPEEYRVGQVYSMEIEGIPGHYTAYRLYKGDEILSDVYGTSYKAHPYGEEVESAQMLAYFHTKPFDWEEDVKPAVPFSEAVFYGLHVRGFTMGKGSQCRHKGTFTGIMEKLNYLQDLGITSLLLMPAYEFIENEQIKAVKTPLSGQVFAQSANRNYLNYWGYKKGYYYAPKASYSATKDPVTEMKQLIKACHQKGMELFMQFYFPTEVQEPEIIRILEHWIMEYHVDGFQIMAGHINIQIIKDAPSLTDAKLIFYDFADHAGQESGRSYVKKTDKRLCIYRDNTMNDFRRFLKGDEYTLESMMYHFRKNGRNVAYLNSIADYSGFRIADLVSYDYKHNEANGENNSDGTNFNYSWNCGVEGPTKKKAVLQLRARQMKNALSFVFLSQGTPYIFMGDEMGFSQQGNNNPYNQDNDTTWLDWRCLRKNSDIYEFTKRLIAYRKAHRILRMDEYLAGTDIMGCGYPNISFHSEEAYKAVFEPYRRELGVLLCGKYARERDGREDKMIYIIYNMHWEAHTFALPKLPKGEAWHVALQTSPEELEIVTIEKEIALTSKVISKMSHEEIVIAPRSVVVLES